MPDAPVVIKIGGSALAPGAETGTLWRAVAAVAESRPVAVVHGGGPLVDRRLAERGFVSDKIDGIRATPEQHLSTVVGALAGEMNAQITAKLIGDGVRAVGMALGAALNVRINPDPRLGSVGAIGGGDGGAVPTLLGAGFVPVLSSIGIGISGAILNVNADDAAVGLAGALRADSVWLLSDVPGVLDESGRPMPRLTIGDIERLIDEGTVSGGMCAKIRAAARAAEATGARVVIASWSDPRLADGVGEIGTSIEPSGTPSATTGASA
ncbi:MAG: acetylglutamate kinase [Planctomycetota bacterium]